MTRRWLTRLLLVLGLAIGFQVLLKPMRMIVVHDILIPAVRAVQAPPSQFDVQMSRSVGFYVTDANNPDQKSSEWFAYTGFGNLYFLIGAAMLILMGRGWKSVAWLFALHVSLSTLAGLFMVIGFWSNAMGWMYAMDFTVSKAVPAATGFFVLSMKRT